MAEWLPVKTQMSLSLLESSQSKNILDQKWSDFCRRWRNQTGQEQEIIDVVDQIEINKINFYVNRFPYRKDEDDYWTCSPTGDCEDKALEKRRMLNDELDIPMGAMSMMIVRNRNDITHAVLVIHTTEGDYVLDNENALILPWDKCDFIKYAYININNDWYKITK